jgi:hypothetical protein
MFAVLSSTCLAYIPEVSRLLFVAPPVGCNVVLWVSISHGLAWPVLYVTSEKWPAYSPVFTERISIS